jgi:iron(III) transport system ATP-binding protein
MDHHDIAPSTRPQTSRWGRRGTVGVSFAASLAFDRVGHSFGARQVLDAVSLRVEPAEVLCLLGPSGCGKTTLLRIAAGLERQASGRVLLNDREMASDSLFVPPERRGIGLVFQDYALFPHRTVLQNVCFGLRRLGRAEAERTGMAALERVGLSHHARNYPHTLSGGEQQRVALARAIAPRPAVLLMDEPFSGLDRRLRDRIRDETLAILRETRTTTIFVTHDPEDAMRVADRIALLRAGRLVQVDTPDVLYRAPVDLAAARFFSEVNEVEGVVRSGSALTPLGAFAAPERADGERVVLCVRPQGVQVEEGEGGDGLPGRVVSRHFLGDSDLMELAVAGLEQPLKARRAATPQLPTGEVRVTIDPAQTLVFAADDTIS